MVPQSGLNKLPFFPKERTRIECCKGDEPIAENYRGRIKIYLFFDHSWEYISNNKLKLQVDPNLEDWLNDKTKTKGMSYSPKTLAPSFRKWLSDCYKNFDKEYKFDNRDKERESRDRGNSAFFKRLTVGNSIDLSSGAILKFPLSSRRDAAKVFGKIVCFEILDGLPKDEERYYGTGKIKYTRMPVEVFGGKEEDISLSAINFQTDVLNSQFVNELLAIKKQAPAKIKIFLHETDDSNAVVIKQPKEGGGMYSNTFGNEFYKISVQIVDHTGTLVCYKPETKTKYKIQIRVGETNFGITNDLWHTVDGVDAIKDIKGKQATIEELKSSFFAFYGIKRGGNITFGAIGDSNMQIDVLDPDDGRAMASRIITIKTSPRQAEPVHSFSLEEVPHSVKALGSTLPALKFFFLDRSGEVTYFSGEVQVRAIAQDMVLDCEGCLNPHVPMYQNVEGCEDDNGVLAFCDDQWHSVPASTDGSFFNDPNNRMEREVQITFSLHLSKGDLNGRYYTCCICYIYCVL